MDYEMVPFEAISAEIALDFEAAAVSVRPWSSTAHAAAKTKLKSALLAFQKGRCAYCRRFIRDEVGHLEIDHILPKASFGDPLDWGSNDNELRKSTAGYPAFTFVPFNLALTCKRCNNKKGTYDCRVDRSAAASSFYNLDSQFYSWLHPYLDSYPEHITLVEGMIYQATLGSAKGSRVIEVCRLDKLAAVERLAAQVKTKNARAIGKAIGLLLEMVDHYGWDLIADVVQERFPEASMDYIWKRIEAFKVAMTD